jgi:hypothetical protein
MTYAVSVCDLLTLSKRDKILHMLIAPHVDRARVVEAERGKVAGIGHAALLACPEEQAAAIVAVARQRYAKHECRFYVSATGNGGWRQV